MSDGLYGLVLAGGQSTRMGSDKALLSYHGKPHLDYLMEVVAPYVQQSFVSIRPEQRHESVRARFSCLVDDRTVTGPAAGILAAYRAFPKASWLILACDLPFIDPACLAHLCDQWRLSSSRSLAYRNADNGLPEPLCAIWTPPMLAALSEYVAQGYVCPRRALIKQESALLDTLNANHVNNANSQADRAAALAQMGKDA
ncbi:MULTISPECIES: NTP transferase domain-containing protein [unclassified Saccharibacter]|uniref:NTP transferase domain-containing protein n=1 Tax=unclassified Saccharibacter TaxID=2648722 RepID=UPI001320F407|nr:MULTISPECIES: NTP transferase domain-containing protein [unclassified Saccharibacter]MXV36651.1 NTP transferase domain-containing protein [Saccharibacter sp. EH611]MXV58789.1 NTP transferase domain-containing protein [Saccharibacter sp. EH70]MXV65599.1 NTP transferase domain-containing protein [Saccharibacter sp. EH60]